MAYAWPRPAARDPRTRSAPSALHAADREATPELIAACRAAAIPLRVYTVNQVERFRQLAAAGVDAVFTDDPALLASAGAE